MMSAGIFRWSTKAQSSSRSEVILLFFDRRYTLFMRNTNRAETSLVRTCAALAGVLLALFCDAPLAGQSGADQASVTGAIVGKLEFEVASIKPTAGLHEQALVQAIPGRVNIQNFTPRTLIQFAYEVADYQVLGGPSWIRTDHYDVQAKAEGNPSSRQMTGPMLQSLLADRFRLSFHRETRQMTVYALTVPKGSAKLEPTANGNCIVYSMDLPPPGLPQPGSPQPNFCGFPRTLNSGLNRTLDGKAITLAQLATSLSRGELHRPMIDKTGLDGRFDIHLTWMTEPPNAEPGVSDGPSIFTALQEQLNLKLESTRGPVEVLVIDRIERPSEN